MLDWLYHRSEELLLVQEHHLHEAALKSVQQSICRKGWQPLSQPATLTGQGGTHGGLAILHRDHLSVHRHHSCNIDGHGWLATVAEEDPQSILLISIYLKNSVGLEETTNATILAELMACIQQWSGPWIVAGDWNVDPAQLQETQMPNVLQGEVIAPTVATVNTGSLLDYVLASRDLSPHLHLTIDWECPWKPHGVLQVWRDNAGSRCCYPQMDSFPALPQPNEEYQIHWEQFHAVTHEDFLQQELNAMGKNVAQWASISEQYLLQNMPEGREGRGRNVQVAEKPLKIFHKTGKWRRAHWIYWQRFEDLVSQKNITHSERWKMRVQQLQQTVETHWPEDQHSHLALFQSQLQQWLLTEMDHCPQELIEQIVQRRVDAQTSAMQADTLHYKEWLQAGLQKGCKGICKALRGVEMQWQRPYRDLPLSARPEARRRYWAQIWGDLDQPLEFPNMMELQHAAKQEAATWPPLELEPTMRQLKRLTPKACGLDGISIDMVRNAPASAVMALISLFHGMESSMQLPTQFQSHLIALLPKNGVSERPIALMSVLYRVWVRLRWGPLKAWQTKMKDVLPWEAAMPGVQVADVALTRMLKAEVHRFNGRHAGQMLLDLSAFYDRAQLLRLVQAGEALGYPLPHLCLGAQAYAGQRWLQGEGVISQGIWPKHGILPGCPQAPLMAKLNLWPVLQAFVQQFPTVEIEVWIDDIGFAIAADNPEQVACVLLEAYRFIKRHLEQEGLVLSAEKSGVIVTDKLVDRAYQQQCAADEPQIHRVMKDLGLDATAGRCRRIPTIRKRSYKGKHRFSRLIRLKVGSRACKVRVIKGGIHSVIAYGAEGLGIPPMLR